MLEIKNLSLWLKSYNGYLRVLENLNLSINKNEIYALVGESGSGKSMTANTVTRLLPESATFVENSYIYFQGEDLLAKSERQMRNIRKQEIRMIFQEPMSALNPVLKVSTQLVEAIKLTNENIKGINYKEQAIKLLEQVRIADAKSCLNCYPHQLSGGMKQRVLIAIALAGNPKLLIADEPTTALDVTIQADILKLIKKIQKNREMSVLFISHDLAVVSQIADKIGVMYAGELVEVATVNEFFSAPKHPYSQKLLLARPDKSSRNKILPTISGSVPGLINQPLEGCKFYQRCEYQNSKCLEGQEMQLITHQHLARCHYWQNIPFPIESHAQSINVNLKNTGQDINLLQVKNLSVKFWLSNHIFKRKKNYIYAVNNISFTIKRGKTLAIVGESGCGKSTLAKTILQLNNKNNGQIYFKNKEVNKKSKQLKKAIQIIFQDPFSSMNPKMMIKDILLEGIKALKITKAKSEQLLKLKRLLSLVGLPEDALYQYPHEFSGGQKQRIAIARALSVDPELVICDEPTSALDVSIQAQILNLLKSIQNEFSLTYLFITHDLSVVSYIADEVLVMYSGKVLEQGPVHNILTKPNHPYTKSLLNSAPSINKKLPIQQQIPQELPTSSIDLFNGCPYYSRCLKSQEKCQQETPQLLLHGKCKVACFFPEN